MLIGYRAGEFGNRCRLTVAQNNVREELRRERQREQEAAAPTKYFDARPVSIVDRRPVREGGWV